MFSTTNDHISYDMPNAKGYNKQTHSKYNWPKYALAILKILPEN
jgi:hypothetical protein